MPNFALRRCCGAINFLQRAVTAPRNGLAAGRRSVRQGRAEELEEDLAAGLALCRHPRRMPQASAKSLQQEVNDDLAAYFGVANWKLSHGRFAFELSCLPPQAIPALAAHTSDVCTLM